MLNKPKENWSGRTFSAGVGAFAAAVFSIAHGQPPLVTILVISCAIVFTLILDEIGII
jgi:hypothetical protein